mgnify:FL=1
MRQPQANDPDNVRAAISAWWDDESAGNEKALAAMLDDVEQVDARTRD